MVEHINRLQPGPEEIKYVSGDLVIVFVDIIRDCACERLYIVQSPTHTHAYIVNVC